MLADILAPLVGKTECHVKNSGHLAEMLADLHLEEDEMLVSHDVVSLFTNIPIEAALEVIKDKLETDDSWKDVTALEVEDIIELLRFVLSTTYFVFRGQIYRQKFGTAMGSPVSPLVADLFMEFLEQKALNTATSDLKPRVWKRYVDDIMEVIKVGKLDEFTDFLNQMDDTGSIKFTHETELDGKLPFLDILLNRKEDGKLKIKVYRKPTHTDQYLSFDSHHPLEHKLSVARTLFQRSNKLVTEIEDRQEENKHIENALKDCGYPDWCFRQVKRQMEVQEHVKGRSGKDLNVKPRTQVVIPYVENVSSAIARVFKKHGVATATRPLLKLRNLLVHPKDKMSTEETTECVYRIPCKNCDKIYVGETGRRFGTRLSEHRKEVEASCSKAYTRSRKLHSTTEHHKSAITDHAVQQNHVIDWAGADIVDKASDRRTRWIKEAIHIRKEGRRALNRDEGSYTLSHVYDRLLAATSTCGSKNRNKSQF